MLNLVGQNAENQRLHLGHGLGLGCAIGHGTGDGSNLGDPTAILLLFDFNLHGREARWVMRDGKAAFSPGRRGNLGNWRRSDGVRAAG